MWEARSFCAGLDWDWDKAGQGHPFHVPARVSLLGVFDEETTWPLQFNATFVENFPAFAPGASNTGRWIYDWPGRRSIFMHGDGQHNNFCACADKATTAACHLHFMSDGTMWARFPATGRCCKVCDAGAGCSTMRPDWLLDATFLGDEEHDGRMCETWAKPGAVAEVTMAEAEVAPAEAAEAEAPAEVTMAEAAPAETCPAQYPGHCG